MLMSIKTTSGDKFFNQFHNRSTVASFSDDLDVCFACQECTQTLPHEFVIVSDQQANGHLTGPTFVGAWRGWVQMF
ncbi:MAG: hypothetical protein ACI93T_001902 [Porticoccaceae bacterium]|jgi:hypothetical protein